MTYHSWYGAHEEHNSSDTSRQESNCAASQTETDKDVGRIIDDYGMSAQSKAIEGIPCFLNQATTKCFSSGRVFGFGVLTLTSPRHHPGHQCRALAQVPLLGRWRAGIEGESE